MPNRRSVEDEYRVEGSVLDELGLDRQAVLELKLKTALHQKILQWMNGGAGSRSKASDRSVRPTRVDAREAFHVECGAVAALCRFVGG
jgi:hypothetical protein